MANPQIASPQFPSSSYENSTEEEDEEEKYRSGVFKVDIPTKYDYVVIKSRHIGCLPLKGNHLEDLDKVSKEKFTLIYIYDKSISDKLRYFNDDDKQSDDYDEIHENVSEFFGNDMAYALLTSNEYKTCSVCQFMSILEKAWGEKSRNNLSYISADRVKEEYLLKVRNQRKILFRVLVINLGEKLE